MALKAAKEVQNLLWIIAIAKSILRGSSRLNKEIQDTEAENRNRPRKGAKQCALQMARAAAQLRLHPLLRGGAHHQRVRQLVSTIHHERSLLKISPL
jgi:hypothetical protein